METNQVLISREEWHRLIERLKKVPFDLKDSPLRSVQHVSGKRVLHANRIESPALGHLGANRLCDGCGTTLTIGTLAVICRGYLEGGRARKFLAAFCSRNCLRRFCWDDHELLRRESIRLLRQDRARKAADAVLAIHREYKQRIEEAGRPGLKYCSGCGQAMLRSQSDSRFSVRWHCDNCREVPADRFCSRCGEPFTIEGTVHQTICPDCRAKESPEVVPATGPYQFGDVVTFYNTNCQPDTMGTYLQSRQDEERAHTLIRAIYQRIAQTHNVRYGSPAWQRLPLDFELDSETALLFETLQDLLGLACQPGSWQEAKKAKHGRK